LVHYASVFGKVRSVPLRGVEEFVTGYREDPKMDFHTMVAEMAQISRKQAKTINLGMMYGMGAKKMAEQLDIPIEESKELVNQYHERVPFVKMLMRGVTDRLNDKDSGGSIRSLKGRKCRFDLWEPDTFEMNKALPHHEAVRQYGQTTRLKRAYTYKALNRLIQASAADMTKQAMVNVYQAGKIPLIQIHDELAVSVTGKKEAQSIAKIMTNAIELDVPSRCDIEIGASWGEAK
jgi:DNA polymerase I-like protein with 3'-5' exonuclease and polymerase domains